MKYNLTFNFKNDDCCLTIDDIEKTLSVKKNAFCGTYKLKEYYCNMVYAIRKTFIGCYSAENLFKHFKECIDLNFAVECWAIEPLNRIIENTKRIEG